MEKRQLEMQHNTPHGGDGKKPPPLKRGVMGGRETLWELHEKDTQMKPGMLQNA